MSLAVEVQPGLHESDARRHAPRERGDEPQILASGGQDLIGAQEAQDRRVFVELRRLHDLSEERSVALVGRFPAAALRDDPVGLFEERLEVWQAVGRVDKIAISQNRHGAGRRAIGLHQLGQLRIKLAPLALQRAAINGVVEVGQSHRFADAEAAHVTAVEAVS